MAAPITGPFTVTVFEPLTGVKYRYAQKTGYKQAQPYDVRTAYTAFDKRTLTGSWDAANNYDSQWNSWWLQAASGDPYESTFQSALTNARNQAVSRFNEKRGEKAAMAVAIAEGKQGAQMIGKRLAQLYRAAKALKNLRFYDVAVELELVRKRKPSRKRSNQWKRRNFKWVRHPRKKMWYPIPQTAASRREAHRFSDWWLEYSLGWAPMVSDVFAAATVLSKPWFYREQIKARGKQRVEFVRTQAPPGYSLRSTTKATVSCQVGAHLTVQNPNQDLANRMGLVNPLTVALELIPFSFIAGWFVNLNEFVSQFTEYYGVKVEGPYFTDFCECNGTHEFVNSVGVTTYTQTTWAVSVIRTIGSLPFVNLSLRPAFHLSLRRALVSSALLVKLFTSAK